MRARECEWCDRPEIELRLRILGNTRWWLCDRCYKSTLGDPSRSQKSLESFDAPCDYRVHKREEAQ